MANYKEDPNKYHIADTYRSMGINNNVHAKILQSILEFEMQKFRDQIEIETKRK